MNFLDVVPFIALGTAALAAELRVRSSNHQPAVRPRRILAKRSARLPAVIQAADALAQH